MTLAANQTCVNRDAYRHADASLSPSQWYAMALALLPARAGGCTTDRSAGPAALTIAVRRCGAEYGRRPTPMSSARPPVGTARTRGPAPWWCLGRQPLLRHPDPHSSAGTPRPARHQHRGAPGSRGTMTTCTEWSATGERRRIGYRRSPIVSRTKSPGSPRQGWLSARTG